MKSTLLFICSLLCLAFFSWQLVQTGQPIEPSKDAYEQVMDAKAAELLLKDQQGYLSSLLILGNRCPSLNTRIAHHN